MAVGQKLRYLFGVGSLFERLFTGVHPTIVFLKGFLGVYTRVLTHSHIYSYLMLYQHPPRGVYCWFLSIKKAPLGGCWYLVVFS